MTEEEYYGFKQACLERKNGDGLDFGVSLMEQVYDKSKLYWHVSHEKFEQFSPALDHPIWIARRVDFFFRENHQFDLRKNVQGYAWIYATKLAKKLNIFNPKNPKDLENIAPIIEKCIFSQKSSNPERLKLLWNAYVDTGYWKFIEHDGEVESPGYLLYDCIKPEYDGFLISSNSSFGSMGIFDSANLAIQGPPMKVEDFMKIFSNKKPYKMRNITPYDVAPILRQSEELRTADENNLLKLMGLK